MNRMDFEKIPFPTEEEKNRSIAHIVEKGVGQPCCISMVFSVLRKGIGLQGLFFGVEDCVFLSFLGAVLLWTGVFTSVKQDSAKLYLLIFLISPFLYAVLHLLTVWKDIMMGTYERFMTLRISLWQMTVVRMLIFGGVSVVFSVGMSIGFWLLFANTDSLLRMLSLSFASLFLFAWTELLIEWKWRVPASYFMTPGIWAVFGIILLGSGEHVQQSVQYILLSVPVAVFFMIGFIFAVLYLKRLRKYYFVHKEGALNHVVN